MDSTSANFEEQYSQGKKYQEYMQPKNPLTEEQMKKVKVVKAV